MRNSYKSRLTTVMVLCFGIAGVISLRAAYVQFWHNPRLDRMSRLQFQSKVLIRPRRGTITDRNGEPLAVNVEANSLAANPEKIHNPRILARLLSKSLDLPFRGLVKHLSERREFIWIRRHLTQNQMNRLKRFRLVDSDGDLAQGLWLVKESERVYPHGQLASHILGDVNIDSEGVEGIELWKNSKLRGKVVSVRAIKDALGRPTFIDAVAADRVKDGENVELTIDSSLQYAVEEALHSAVVKHGALSGTVIVMNAANGEILAMANQPTFNPNLKSAAESRRRNRAVTDGYEPGSTLKAVLMACALSHGWKTTDRVYGNRGSIEIQGHKISEAESKEKFGWISLKQIIQYSSNVGAAKVALSLGADKYMAMLRKFGFGMRTGLGFPGEISGVIPPRKRWKPLTLANIGFGQGILVTPLQMVRAYATFVNGGYLVRPKLIRNSVQSDPAPIRIISRKVANGVVSLLEGVTEPPGTGVNAGLDGYRVAGKTGTAQMVDPRTHRYSHRKFVASFIGFPVGVEPKIVIFASVTAPKGNYYASDTAAPLFHDVLNAAVTRFAIPADPALESASKKLASSDHSDELKLSQAKDIEVDETAKPAALKWAGTTATGKMIWFMPSLHGLTAREAMEVLEGHAFRLEVHGDGVVRSQYPQEGKPLAEGETVRLSLGDP